ACVRLLADAGGNVVVADVNRQAGEMLAKELGKGVRFVATDVTDEASVQNAVNNAVQTFGGLHGSIQCAGIAIAERVLGKAGPHRHAASGRPSRSGAAIARPAGALPFAPRPAR